jgi:hypothetical protein
MVIAMPGKRSGSGVRIPVRLCYFCVDTESREAHSLYGNCASKQSCNTKPAGKGMLQDIHKRALRRAAEVIGGNEELRVYLGVSEVEFVSWAGKRELPRDIFLHLVDIITGEQANVRKHRPLPVAARGAGRQMKSCE